LNSWKKKLYDEIENIVSISFFLICALRTKQQRKERKKNGKEPALEKS
jgi:hypothetical protein